jgi:hypothetical protein
MCRVSLAVMRLMGSVRRLLLLPTRRVGRLLWLSRCGLLCGMVSRPLGRIALLAFCGSLLVVLLLGGRLSAHDTRRGLFGNDTLNHLLRLLTAVLFALNFSDTVHLTGIALRRNLNPRIRNVLHVANNGPPVESKD